MHQRNTQNSSQGLSGEVLSVCTDSFLWNFPWTGKSMEDLGFTEISNVAQQMEHTGRESGHNTKEGKYYSCF